MAQVVGGARRSLSVLLIAALTLVVAVAACGGGDEEGEGSQTTGGGGGKAKVALVTINQQALFFTQMIDGAEAAAREEGVDLTVFNANNDPAAQNTAVENFTQQDFDAIIVVAIDVEGIKPAIKTASDAGVHVIAVDAIVEDPAVEVQIGVDNQGAGEQIGQFFSDWAADNVSGGKAKIGIVGALNSFIQNIRQKGFEKTVKADGHTIVQVVDGRNVQENALAAAENLVTGQPDLDAIYTTGEPATVGAIAALKSQGATDRVMLFGWDLTAEVIEAIDAGFVVGIVQQDPETEGAEAVKAAAALAGGDTVEKTIDVPITIVTKDNVDEYRDVFK